jgi:hypothetical protein
MNEAFADVARKVGDPRLAETLKKLASNVIRIEVRNAKFALRRAEVRADMKRLKAKTKQFETMLNNVYSKWFLDLPIDDADKAAARQTISDIDRLCDDVLSLVSSKGGAPSAPGMVTCAVIVIEAWASVHGRLPGHNNEHAQNACDDYWVACGGNREGDPSKWRRHITAARKSQRPLHRYIHDEIARRGTE